MATINEILKKFESNKISLQIAEEMIYDIIRMYKKEIFDNYDEEIKKVEEYNNIKIQEIERRNKIKIQENCNHDFGPPHWVDSCNYYRECKKCDKTIWEYERD